MSAPVQPVELSRGDSCEGLDTASTDDYFLDIPNSQRLALLFTLKCNWRCAHCLVGSAPERTERFSLEQAMDVVSSAARSGVTIVWVTGGEVFLYYRPLLALLEHIRSVGCRSVVETNGFWARNDQVAETRLAELLAAGMSCMALSIDVHHLREGGIDRSLRIAHLCRRMHIPCRVLSVASDDPEADHAVLAELRRRDIPYFYEELMAIGRGRDLAAPGGAPVEHRCDSIGKALLPNGDLFSCFGASDDNSLLKRTPMYAGNVFEGDSDRLFAEERHNLFARAIDRLGHAFLIELLQRGEGTHVPEWRPGDSMCSFCQRMLSDEANVAYLAARLPHVEELADDHQR